MEAFVKKNEAMLDPKKNRGALWHTEFARHVGNNFLLLTGEEPTPDNYFGQDFLHACYESAGGNKMPGKGIMRTALSRHGSGNLD